MGRSWLNFGSIRVNGTAGQRSICLLSPAIAQRTGVNKSVSFARWQQGVEFVVPRTTACYDIALWRRSSTHSFNKFRSCYYKCIKAFLFMQNIAVLPICY